MKQSFRNRLLPRLRHIALALPVAVSMAAVALAVTAPLNLACAQSATWTDAEVKKVDREAAKVTLKHAEIKNLDMPAMTMAFKVQDRAMLEGLAPGAKVRFRVEQKSGVYLVTELQRAP